MHAVPPTSRSTAGAEPGSAQLLPSPLHQTSGGMLAHSEHHCHRPYTTYHHCSTVQGITAWSPCSPVLLTTICSNVKIGTGFLPISLGCALRFDTHPNRHTSCACLKVCVPGLTLCAHTQSTSCFYCTGMSAWQQHTGYPACSDHGDLFCLTYWQG